MDNKEMITDIAGMYFIYKLIPLLVVLVVIIIVGLYMWMNPSNCSVQCGDTVYYKNVENEEQCNTAAKGYCPKPGLIKYTGK